jgi:3-isopropylmalate/(R)-2-methylmalate dehydratase small subunit
MMSPDPETLANWAFESIRYDANGAPRDDFVLNGAEYVGSEILLAGDNFGCGSSREPAVWAVMGLGFRCVIAPSFGDIFAANCLTNGVLPVTLSADAVEQLARGARRFEEVTVDLPTQEVRLGSRWWAFEIGRVHKLMLVDALDEMALAIGHLENVERWEIRDHHERAWAWPKG